MGDARPQHPLRPPRRHPLRRPRPHPRRKRNPLFTPQTVATTQTKTSPRISYFSLCPKSRPNLGADLVPLIFTGISAPPPSFLKNGSTGFNRIDFHFYAPICATFASVRIFPANSNWSPSSEYSPVNATVAPGNV